MTITDKDKAIIIDLIRFAWQGGGIRSPQMGAEVQDLASRIAAPKPKEEKPEGKGK